jgi:hypothetical protein
MDEAIRTVIAVGDRVAVVSHAPGGRVVGEVISVTSSFIKYRKYIPMTAEVMKKFSLQPIMASIFPVLRSWM